MTSGRHWLCERSLRSWKRLDPTGAVNGNGMPPWGVVILRRILLATALIGVSVIAATPSIAATSGHSVPWASLGVVRPLLIQPSGWGSPIAAQPRSTTFGWCAPKGVEISSSGGQSTLISDSSVGQMLKNFHLALPSSPGSSREVATCEDVALDPSHPKTVYAGFQASQGGLIPPSYEVALVTSNMGRSWQFVPPPHGDSLMDFAGFVERPSGVEMLYSSNYFFPLKSGQSATFVAATSSTGGRSWTDVRLGCPAGAPCVIFGPEAPQGACGMSEWQQSVLVGATYEYRATTRWRAAGAVTSVSQCGSQQLVATASGDEFLVDHSRPNALLYTHDGIHWTAVSLPKIDGAPVGGRSVSFGQMMTLVANGALIAVAGSPLETAERLEMLKPGSTAWCITSAVLPAATRQDPVAAIQSSESALVVAFLTPIPTGGGAKAMALAFPLSRLRCRT